MGLTRVILSRELSLDEIEEINNVALKWRLKSSYTALCVLLTQVAVCCQVILITAIRTKVHAPTPAAGITKLRMRLKMKPVICSAFGRNH